MANLHEPVRHTCPDIDKCIKWLKYSADEINSVIVFLENMQRESDLDLNFCDQIRSLNEALHYQDISGLLEELRSSNSALRDWGHELAREISLLENT